MSKTAVCSKYKYVLLILINLFILSACDQPNLKTPSGTDENPSSNPIGANPSQDLQIVPSNIPSSNKADLIVNGKMYYINSNQNFYYNRLGKVEKDKITFIDSDVDFISNNYLTYNGDYQNIYPDGKGGFYLTLYLNGSSSFVYLNGSGKLTTKIDIPSGWNPSRALKCTDCPNNHIYFLGYSQNDVYDLNTEDNTYTKVSIDIRTCGSNNTSLSACSLDTTWNNISNANLGNYSRQAIGKYLYYKTNIGDYVYFNGQYYTGFIAIDIITKQVTILNFNFEYQISPTWYTATTAQYNSIKIFPLGDNPSPHSDYPVFTIDLGTFGTTPGSQRVSISLPNGINIGNLSLGPVKYLNKVNFNFKEGFFIKSVSGSTNLCYSNDLNTVSFSLQSSKICNYLNGTKLAQTTHGTLGISTLNLSYNYPAASNNWITTFDFLDLNNFMGAYSYQYPIFDFDIKNSKAYYLGKTNYSGYENKTALYIINTNDGSLIQNPILINDKFSSGSIIVSGDYFLATNLYTGDQNALKEIDPKTGSINEITFSLKLGGSAISFNAAVKKLLALPNNKILISGSFDTVNEHPSQGFFIYDPTTKEITYSSHVFSNNTYYSPECDSDGNLSFYSLLPVAGLTSWNGCGYYTDLFLNIHLFKNKLYVTGNFDKIDGITRYGFAVIDLDLDTVTAFNPIPAVFNPPTVFADPLDSSRATSVPKITSDIFLLSSGFSEYLFLYGTLHTNSSTWSTQTTGYRLNPNNGSQFSQVILPITGSNMVQINDSVISDNFKFYDLSTGLTLPWEADKNLYNISNFGYTDLTSIAVYKNYVLFGVSKRDNHAGAVLLAYKVENNNFSFYKDLSSFVPIDPMTNMVPINGDLYQQRGVAKLQVYEDSLIITTQTVGNKIVKFKDLGL